MLRGTRIIAGEDAKDYTDAVDTFRKCLISAGFSELIIPSIWESETFLTKLGEEKENQMWVFEDKGERKCCLIPEVTGVIQEMWNSGWSREFKKPYKVFYVSRCYRYERPQEGRYREFTQIGVEILGGSSPSDKEEALKTLNDCLSQFDLDYELFPAVKRGLEYYVEDGFEVECSVLGAQKQIAGGGRYKEGIGWAVGLDRLLLAKKKQQTKE